MHFDNRLGLDDHEVFIEEMEALHEQFVAAAFDVEHAEEAAGVAGELAFGAASIRGERHRC